MKKVGTLSKVSNPGWKPQSVFIFKITASVVDFFGERHESVTKPACISPYAGKLGTGGYN